MTLAKHWKYGKDEDIVVTQLRGLVASNPYVNLIPSEKVVFNPHSDTSKKLPLSVAVVLDMNLCMEDLLERIY